MGALLRQPAHRWPAGSAPGFGRALLIAALFLPSLVFAPAHAQALDILERTAPAAEQGQAEDVLILHEGGVTRGALLGCAGDGCTFAGTSVPRDTVAWLGLEAEEPTPPGAQDTCLDEVPLRDASVHPGPLVGISQYGVVTGRGFHPPDDLAWIHLARAEPERDDAPDQIGRPVPASPPAKPFQPVIAHVGGK